MAEFIYRYESPDDLDARGWTNVLNDIKPFEWRHLDECVDAPWTHREVYQCQCHSYHLYKHRYPDLRWPPNIMITRPIGPMLHVNVEMPNDDTVQFIYTMSGNLICQLNTDKVAGFMPSISEIEYFIRIQTGLTRQQEVFLHFPATIISILKSKKAKTTTQSTQC